ncbi:MAG: NifU family protein [Bacteroidia bacterium]|jgi:Fe-S cluster biogenesis protein NfuA|nr:NifU family protein [Bacteroidia bacterium]|tara:strand:- start:5410 stop:5640 length:231 start_codon:yes stop_codon:yes gene_type:complete
MTLSENKIEEALESIRPFLKQDGGDIEFISYDNNVVKLRFLGACSTCSISHLTMKAGIEESIKKLLPEVESVLAIE